MKLIPLPFETKALTGFNYKLVLTYADLATWTSGTAQAVFPDGNALGAATLTMPAGMVIGRALLRVVTAFTSSGGAISSLGFSLGDGNSGTRYFSAVDCKTAAYTASTNVLFPNATADTVDATATIVGQTMASLNAGQIEIYFETVDAARLGTVSQP